MWHFFSIENTWVTVGGYPLSYIEFTGTVTGLISVWLAMRNNILTWSTGLINEVCFFLIFYQVHLYADMFLQVYFFITSVYGWIVWARGKQAAAGGITVLTRRSRGMLGLIIMLSTLLVGWLVSDIHLLLPHIFTKPASYPFTDTFVAVLSIVATILLAQRKLENWVLWITVDIICVVLYAKKQVLFISIEYFVFLILASAGMWTWKKILRHEKRISAG